MENVAPHTQADIDFVEYIKKFEKRLTNVKKDNGSKNDEGRSLNEALNTIFFEFYNTIKTRRVLPSQEKKKDDEALVKTFFTLISEMTTQSLKNY